MALMTAYPALGSVFAPNGVPKKEGDLISQPQLAATLAAIADSGVPPPLSCLSPSNSMTNILFQAFAFYDPAGTIAQSIVQDINNAGGNFSLTDLQNYYNNGVKVRSIGWIYIIKSHLFRLKIREVESGWYQGYQYFGGGAPFSGGICLIFAMNILERYDIPALNRSTLAYHWIAEALAFTFSDRLALGDPQFVNLTDILPPMVIHRPRTF